MEAEKPTEVAEVPTEAAEKPAEVEKTTEVGKPAAQMEKYGTHNGITCDGCAVRPIQGFRYKCTKCKNHDLCETCFSFFKAGKLVQHPNLARLNKVSQNIEDHVFEPFSEPDGSFVSISGVRNLGPTPPSKKKVKPNEACPCESGKKYKKCCGK